MALKCASPHLPRVRHGSPDDDPVLAALLDVNNEHSAV